MSKIRVLIVDDSPFICKALSRIFDSAPDIDVAGIARDGNEAVEKVIALKPDVVTLDVMMPRMDGIETLKEIMQKAPTPVLMLSQFTRQGAEMTLNALELGALDFIDKSATGMMDFYGLAQEIITKTRAIAGKTPFRITEAPKIQEMIKGTSLVDVVAVGTSTGGPTALQMLLMNFPRDIDFSLLIVQHMPPGFTGPLARRLNSLCKIEVKEAEKRDKIIPGQALIAPAGLHMKIRKHNKIKLTTEPSDLSHIPSADVLFQSVAEHYGSRSIGVLLTGMGSDGVKGLKEIKQQGGITFAQDEATSTIFGMPRVAIESGCVDRVVPITSMAEKIMRSAYR